VGKVFTTHATILGRSIAGSGRDLYAELPGLDPAAEAKRLGVADKFTAERACAGFADVFTTVSASTAMEAEKILGRKPDVLVLNGLDSATFPTMEDLSILHHEFRDKMRAFFSYYFFPYPDQFFDLEHALAFFLVGRYEYRNKGIDLYLEALAKLNEDLRAAKSDRTVVAFIWVPAGVSSTRTDILESKNYFKHIRDYVDGNADEIRENLMRTMISRQELNINSLLSQKFLKVLQKEVGRFQRQGNPPLSTHYLLDEQNDTILREANRLGLDNKPDDRVKLIFYPVYLDGHDGFLNLSYYDAMAACHLGVFPSYYEPWGYTPIESAAMGVPAVTTDLAGCGIYLEEKLQDEEAPGVYVLKRAGKSASEAADGLYQIFKAFTELSHQERVDRKLAAKKAVELTDWKELIVNYIDAHNRAVDTIA
jgi:glycogen(starch) synthase